MLDLVEVKEKAIGFLTRTINRPWAISPNAPLQFEALVYLANKKIISKSEWGRKVKSIWDSWIENKAASEPSRRWFWPDGIEPIPIDVRNPSFVDWRPRFNVESHLSMFRTREVFSIPGYSEAFEPVIEHLGKILRSLPVDPCDEGKRLIWQVIRSPFLRKALKNSLYSAAQAIIEENIGVYEPVLGIQPEDLFFTLYANLDDDHIRIAKSFLNKGISNQSKDGSFYKDVIKTCLFICSVYLTGLDPNGIICKPALAWLEKLQEKNGRWQYGREDMRIKKTETKEEDTFLTVFVLETFDLVSDDKPLPFWVTKPLLIQPFVRGGRSSDHVLAVPKGINWGDVSILFISDEDVEIRAINSLGVKNFEVLGFMDKRSRKPDLEWTALKSFALCSGSISWNEKRASPTLKSRVKILRKRLRELFGIKEDPFQPYRRLRGYEVKFKIAFREEK